MKKQFFAVALVMFLSMQAILITSCGKEDEQNENSGQIPTKFTVEIPSTISAETNTKLSVQADTVKGGELYANLRTFIAVGEVSAKAVEDIMKAIAQHNLNQAMSFSFTSNDDGRVKNVVITENVSFENKAYAFYLKMTDTDGAVAFEVFWNENPISGVAILSFYDFNRNADDKYKNTRYRVDYSENGSSGYEQYMVVYLSDFPIEPTGEANRFGINNLKMWVGKKNGVVEVGGNSNHPNVYLVTRTPVGFAWAFVARADVAGTIAVATVGLPPMQHNSTSDLFTTYSMHNVLKGQFHSILDPIYSAVFVELYLQTALANAQSPAYFNTSGFIGAGANLPTGFSQTFTNLSGLTPYVPKDIYDLKVKFSVEVN